MGGRKPPTPSVQRLQRGLPGYLIPFAPHAFAPQRQLRARETPSPPVFLQISTHFTATPGIPLSSPALKSGSIGCVPPGEPWVFHNRLTEPPTCALRPINPNNACPLRITAAAGTELARASSLDTVKFGGYCPPDHSSLSKAVYNPKAFILHAASLGQAFAHCRSF